MKVLVSTYFFLNKSVEKSRQNRKIINSLFTTANRNLQLLIYNLLSIEKSSKSIDSISTVQIKQKKFKSVFITQHTQRILNKILKTFNHTFKRVKEHASGFQNIYCLKSQIDGHRNGQLGSLAELARFRLNGLCCLAGHFYDL